jgi:hypothetical protein
MNPPLTTCLLAFGGAKWLLGVAVVAVVTLPGLLDLDFFPGRRPTCSDDDDDEDDDALDLRFFTVGLLLLPVEVACFLLLVLDFFLCRSVVVTRSTGDKVLALDFCLFWRRLDTTVPMRGRSVVVVTRFTGGVLIALVVCFFWRRRMLDTVRTCRCDAPILAFVFLVGFFVLRGGPALFLAAATLARCLGVVVVVVVVVVVLLLLLVVVVFETTKLFRSQSTFNAFNKLIF